MALGAFAAAPFIIDKSTLGKLSQIFIADDIQQMIVTVHNAMLRYYLWD